MKARKFSYGSMGTVSHGTLRNQDLLPAFCEELRWLGHRSKELTIIERRVNSALNGRFKNNDEYFDDEESMWDFGRLVEMLQEHALPYMYFGSHVGDGSDYGFWIDDLEMVYDGLKVDDLNKIPNKYNGEVLHINERGNATLYNAKHGKLTEIWSVV